MFNIHHTPVSRYVILFHPMSLFYHQQPSPIITTTTSSYDSSCYCERWILNIHLHSNPGSLIKCTFPGLTMEVVGVEGVVIKEWYYLCVGTYAFFFIWSFVLAKCLRKMTNKRAAEDSYCGRIQPLMLVLPDVDS